MKKLILVATFAALTLATPATINAKSNNVRYSAGIVTGAKSITTQDGNVWSTKRKSKENGLLPLTPGFRLPKHVPPADMSWKS